MSFENKESKYNWASDIIRTKDEARGIRENYRSPQKITEDNQYKDKLIEWMKSLKAEFKERDLNVEYVNTIIEMRIELEKILYTYHVGNISDAYEKMKNIIATMQDESVGLAVSTIQKSYSFNDLREVLNDSVPSTQIEFFRARTSDKYCVFGRNEMLHIPFDMRGRVSSTRFSIPGLPCLYLATTSYCCWLELRTPADYQFNVSAVKVNQKRKILNLTMSADLFEYVTMLVEEYKLENKYVIEALKLWILSYASSFKINEDNRSFKEEYIIPQLIMLASKDLGLDGVSYYSKQVVDDRFAYLIAVNLALFARYKGEKRFSQICKDIEISRSYNFAMFKQIGYSEKYRSCDFRLHMENDAYYKKIGDFERQNEYSSTSFFSFDKYLFSHIAPEIKSINVDEENRQVNVNDDKKC